MKTKPVRTMTFTDHRTKQSLVLDFFFCDGRSDQYRVQLNGKPWLPKAGISDILAELRKIIGRGIAT